jgi:hypothetical protein
MSKFDYRSPSIYLPIGVAVVIMAISCVVQGRWSERWATFPELQLFAESLKEIPIEFGEWKGEDVEGSDERTLKYAGAEGEMVRVYRSASGQEVRVSIICARLLDIFHHTPDRCYPAAGFDMQGEPVQEVFEIGNTKAEFFTTTFLKSEPAGTHSERGFWAWSADGTWIAPTNPKLKFAGQRALYKLYVFAGVTPGTKKVTNDDACVSFIRAFIPEVEQALKPVMQEVGRIPKDAPAESKPAA